MSNFCCSVIRVLVPDANLLSGGSQLPVTHIPLISLLRPRCGVNLSGRLLDMQLIYVQSLKIVIMFRLPSFVTCESITVKLFLDVHCLLTSTALLPLFSCLSQPNTPFFHQVLILAKNDYSPGFSDKPGFTRSWPGSKLGLAPIRCCRMRPKEISWYPWSELVISNLI